MSLTRVGYPPALGRSDRSSCCLWPTCIICSARAHPTLCMVFSRGFQTAPGEAVVLKGTKEGRQRGTLARLAAKAWTCLCPLGSSNGRARPEAVKRKPAAVGSVAAILGKR